MATESFKIESPVFRNFTTIPEDYTAHGRNESPPLHWSGVPPETVELVLICEDPDAPGSEPFVHWVIYNIQANRTKLPGKVREGDSETVEFTQRENSFHPLSYGGPKPPPGKTHHYHFRLFALDAHLK